MKFDLNEWYSNKQRVGVIFDFLGEINSNLISEAFNAVDQKLDRICDGNLRLKKKVYNVFVESLQNVYHHSDVPTASLNSNDIKAFGAIILFKEGDQFKITTGNFIKIEKQSVLKDRIDQVNSLSGVEVTSLYRDILTNEEFSKKGGGGLGMIDIVRKTGNKLEYFFHECDHKHLFFTLDIIIS